MRAARCGEGTGPSAEALRGLPPPKGSARARQAGFSFVSIDLESSRALLERFSVTARLEVRAAIEDLVRAGAPITLHPAETPPEPFESRLLAIERETILLEAGSDARHAHEIARAGPATVVGLLDRLKLQFETTELFVHASGSMLVCPLPRRVARIQRRDAYRVRPGAPRPAQCVLRFADHTQRVYAVLDISATGVAIKLDPSEAPPAIGQRWQHCRIEAPGYPAIPCELEARFLGDSLSGEAAGARLGCQFVRPPPEVQRALQVYVMDVERGRPPPEPGATPACS